MLKGKMISLGKQSRVIFLMAVLIAAVILSAFPARAAALDSIPAEPGANTPCDYLSGENENCQSLGRWADTIDSYLVKTDNGYMRVQSGDDIKGFVVEYYDNAFNRTKKKNIDTELPIWGGFFEHNDRYYIVTGQSNPNDSDQVEVYRVTQFDKNWKRLASAGFFGEHTYGPFDAGSCRMEAVGNQLVVHTCHTMYASSDGVHHQSNYTLQVDMKSMKPVAVSDRYYTPYSSHSFNQFIRKDDNGFVTLDHGDAYPRALMLSKTKVDGATGIMDPEMDDAIYVMTFKGETGNNTTGASVGGMELSDSAYLIAGESVDQNDPRAWTTGNIFVAAVDKRSDDVSIKWITHYKDDGKHEGAGTPLLVKINNNRFAVLWTENVNKDSYDLQTKCVFIDGKGNQTGREVIIDAALSDCTPIIVGSSLVWYVWNNEKTVFYKMPLSAPAQVKKYMNISGHLYKRSSKKDQNITLKCSKCGKTISGKVPALDDYDIFWANKDDDSGVYHSYIEDVKKGDIFEYWVSGIEGAETVFNDFEVAFSDDSKAELVARDGNFFGNVKFKKAGTVKIYIYPKYMPEQKSVFTVKITDPSLAKNNIKAADRKVTVSLKKKKYDLKASNRAGLPMKYSSNNPAIKVDSNGRITVKAKYIGKAVITITTPLTDKYREAKHRVTIKVLPPKTKIVSAKSGKRKASVKWKKQTRFVNGYQVQYALNKKFKKAKKVTVAGKKKSKATVKRLKSGKRYYVRVRTYKTVKGTKYYSLWSKTKTVKVR